MASVHFLMLSLLVLQYYTFNVSGLECYNCVYNTSRESDCKISNKVSCNSKSNLAISENSTTYSAIKAGLLVVRKEEGQESKEYFCYAVQYVIGGHRYVERGCRMGDSKKYKEGCNSNKGKDQKRSISNFECVACEEDVDDKPCNGGNVRNGGHRHELFAGQWNRNLGLIVIILIGTVSLGPIHWLN